MELSLLHWHIELSSICTLKCPRCPRLEVPESLLNRQLTLDFFKNQIGEEYVLQMKRVTFCGNDGDPIYCKDYLKIVRWLKEVNPSLCIVTITNGSHKTVEWWSELAEILNEYDEIHFSMDGYTQEMNEKYRVNCDYTSIINGINTFNSKNKKTYKVWAAIVFNFNQDKLLPMKMIAQGMGFDALQLTLSTKFGSKYPSTYSEEDELQPREEFIPDGHRFERKVITLTDKNRYSEEVKNFYKDKISNLEEPRLCLVGNKGIFLNSHGEFYPCCWVANRYDHNKEWIDYSKENFNLNNKSFKEIMKDSFWKNEFLKFDNLECKTKCEGDCLKDESYLLEW